MNKNFWKNKNVLITGHTGFKGTWLTLCLSRMGANIIGISDNILGGQSLFESTNALSRLAQHHFIDIRNYDALSKVISNSKPDVLFHLAAQPLVRESYKDPLATWHINVQGSLNVLESLKTINNLCACVMITTDKVYKNKEWDFGYRENDELGGHDPYSASKAAAELAINSWYESFCKGANSTHKNIVVSTARSGNVIGGGDWAKDRIVPDTMKSLNNNQPIMIRNPKSTRPWQHVLEPLNGYILLAEKMYLSKQDNHDFPGFSGAFNFGPNLQSNKSVEELVNEITLSWPGKIIVAKENNANLHEANKLHLQNDKAYHVLGWEPRWPFDKTIFMTTQWYKQHFDAINSSSDEQLCLADLEDYLSL